MDPLFREDDVEIEKSIQGFPGEFLTFTNTCSAGVACIRRSRNSGSISSTIPCFTVVGYNHLCTDRLIKHRMIDDGWNGSHWGNRPVLRLRLIQATLTVNSSLINVCGAASNGASQHNIVQCSITMEFFILKYIKNQKIIQTNSQNFRTIFFKVRQIRSFIPLVEILPLI
ncbi:hypothetical protein [Legionella bononiensis]|uniref:Uncharacterized protein n=1 Tax=Legionella bononiensis TaxID=2793102 RepID=A0ABS1WB41_9GAMM|nr:hypothetical protein [Legionella bononiensis]MBL7526581.1 hypothetical protein [Legionella bononiensis]